MSHCSELNMHPSKEIHKQQERRKIEHLRKIRLSTNSVSLTPTAFFDVVSFVSITCSYVKILSFASLGVSSGGG